jgi:Zn-dependent M28 family amino/carboxypeptidase
MSTGKTRRASGALRVAVAATGAALLWSAAPAATAAPAQAPPGPPPLAERLTRQVSGAGVNRHLIAFQRIAAQNGGTRAAGTAGYDASVAYVVGKLRDAGFDVTTPEFAFVAETVESESVTVNGAAIAADRMQYSADSAVGGTTAPLVLVPVDDTPGCEVEDYAGLAVTGTIAVIRRGACSFAQKQAVAKEAGAVGAIIVNNVPGALPGTLGDPAAAVEGIPTVGVTPEVGAALVAGATATIDLQATQIPLTSRNVIAQTKTGRPDNVVVAGAHLDSVEDGAGINDNGSGSATLLETALRLGGSPRVGNAVRFAWWGAEELGLVGSTAYVDSLSFEQQLDIALYLNFDMTGSPNAAYFAYDGDDSDGVGAGAGPYGSAQLEKTLVDYLQDVKGVPVEGTDFTGRSDYGPFIAAGIPAGGLFTGAEGVKTPAQAAKWGGTAGLAYDPNYHAAGDNLGNIDRVALDRNADAVAHAVGVYGTSTEAVNGVPPRAARAEAQSFGALSVAASAGPLFKGPYAVS